MFCLLVLFSGCAKMQKAEQNIDDTNKRVKALEARIESLSKALDDLNINTGGATSKMKADLTMLLKHLETQLDRLAAEMDESQYRMQQMEKKVDMVNSQRLLLVRDSSSDSSGAQRLDSVKIGGGLDIEKIYQQAREDYIIGKYKLAFKGFSTVLEKDKGGSFKDNALYWMGECFYKQEKLDKAAEYYTRCIKEYPHGNKICSALFKLGMVYDKKKQKEKRNSTWESLIENKTCQGQNEVHRVKVMMNE
jgi:TolA-binding protein